MPISGTMNTSPRLAFVGCEISAGASAGAGGGGGHAHTQGRREVVVSGMHVDGLDPLAVDRHGQCWTGRRLRVGHPQPLAAAEHDAARGGGRPLHERSACGYVFSLYVCIRW